LPKTFAVPTPYQIVFNPTQTTVLSFDLHSDTDAILTSNKLICGTKSYTTDVTWAGVTSPADQATGQFLLWVNTSDFNLAGS